MRMEVEIKTMLCKGSVETSSGARFAYEPHGPHARVQLNATGTGYFDMKSARDAAEFFNNLAVALENQKK